jgi:hypothetical protein
MRRSTLITLLAALMVMAMALGASAAVAGEVNGNGDETAARTHANSICAYSGLNDDPLEEGLFNDGRVQSFGDIFQEAIGALGDGHGASARVPKNSGDCPGANCGGGTNHNRP